MHAVSSSCIVVTSCVTPYGDVGRRPSLKRDAQPLSTAPTSRMFDSHWYDRMRDTLWEFGRRPAAVGRPDSGDGDGGHPREARRGDFTLCPIAAFRWTLAVFLCVSLHVVHCCLSPFFLTRRPPLAHMLARMRRLFTRTSAVFYFFPQRQWSRTDPTFIGRYPGAAVALLGGMYRPFLLFSAAGQERQRRERAAEPGLPAVPGADPTPFSCQPDAIWAARSPLSFHSFSFLSMSLDSICCKYSLPPIVTAPITLLP